MTDVLHLVDGHALGHRAYHAAGGRGWLQAVGVFAAQLDALERRHQPRRAVVVFDVPGRNWRHDIFPRYKADRPRPELELCKAIERWKPLAAALGWPVASARGFEADDVIATLVARARARGWQCLIHASDKDLHQLVGADVHQVTATGATTDPAAVEAKLGVPPARVADWLALCGDTSDGVPGVPGCGAATAAKLCRDYPSIDAVIAAGPELKLRGRYPLASADGVDALRLSRRLVELVIDVELDVQLDALVLGDRDERAVRELLAEPPPPEQLELGARTGKVAAPPTAPAPRGSGRPGRYVPPPPPAAPAPHERLSRDDREFFDERAAIRQLDGHMTRDMAEYLALEDVERARRSA